MCQHPKLIRVKKNNGIQPTDDPNIQMVLGNCPVCKTTDVMGWVINGVERLSTVWEELAELVDENAI